jgi:hypothetical protein
MIKYGILEVVAKMTLTVIIFVHKGWLESDRIKSEFIKITKPFYKKTMTLSGKVVWRNDRSIRLLVGPVVGGNNNANGNKIVGSWLDCNFLESTWYINWTVISSS